MSKNIVYLRQNHSKAKLDEHDVWLIKGLLKEGLPAKVIAAKFEVSKHIIYRIKNGQTWQHVPEYAEERSVNDSISSDAGRSVNQGQIIPSRNHQTSCANREDS